MVVAGVFLLVLAAGVCFTLALTTPEAADPLQQRLAAYSAEVGEEMDLRQVELAAPFIDRVIRAPLQRIGNSLTSRSPAEQKRKAEMKLAMAGNPWGLTAGSFASVRLFAPLVMAGIGGLIGSLAHPIANAGLLGAVMFGAVGRILPSTMVSRKAKARRKAIRKALPNAMDLLCISVEAGLSFDMAIARVCEKYSNPLTEILDQYLTDSRLGRPRVEALRGVLEASDVDDLKGFINAVIQSETLGVGLANVLRVQSEEIRRQRRQRAEEQGQKAPLKMLFPMIGCIFPSLFVVLLGPAIIKVYHTFSGG